MKPKKREPATKKQNSNLPALVLALTATAASGCYSAPPYAYLRIDAPNIGKQPAQPHKREIVQYSKSQPHQFPTSDCNTYAATAQDSMLPPEKQTTVTVCNDGRRWVNYPSAQPSKAAAQPSKTPATPVPSKRIGTPNHGPFNINEIIDEFRSELSSGELWEHTVDLGNGSKLTRIVQGNITGPDVSVSVCQIRQESEEMRFACYIDVNDPGMNTYLDGNVDVTMDGRITPESGLQCFGQLLNKQMPSCLNVSKVQPHERHIKNQEYHRAARWAIRAHQRRR